MTSLFRVRKRAEEFAALVDGGPAPEAHPDLVRLAELTTVLARHDAAVDHARPRPEFTLALRERLLVEAAEVLPRERTLALPPRTRGTRERRLVAAASAVALIGGTAGVAVAAQNALPGDPLYGVKRGLEAAETGLSTDDAGKGRELLVQAEHRLSEARGLLDEDSTLRVPATIATFTEQAREGSALLLRTYERTRDPELIVAIREFTAQALGLLQDLARTAPPSAQDELAEAALTLRDIDAEAAAACGSCAAALPSLQLPEIFLAAAEIRQTLRVLEPVTLDNSHPVVVDKRLLDQVQQVAEGDGTTEDETPTTEQPQQPTGGVGLPREPDTGAGGSSSPLSGVQAALEDAVGELGDLGELLLPESDDTSLELD